MLLFCISLNWLTSFWVLLILASGLLLHRGLPLPESLILYSRASGITVRVVFMSSMVSVILVLGIVHRFWRDCQWACRVLHLFGWLPWVWPQSAFVIAGSWTLCSSVPLLSSSRVGSLFQNYSLLLPLYCITVLSWHYCTELSDVEQN